MRRFKNYILENYKGEILAKGRYKKVMAKAYCRYVYGHIFDDVLYTDGTYIDKNGNAIE
jgi:hypothetical protein